MISFDWDRCGGYGQGDWFRKKVKSVNDRVVEIRTDLQSTLDRTRRNIATFGKLQTSKGNDHQRLMLTCVLKYNTDNLLFELNEKVWYMGVLKNNIDVLLELDKTSESDKGAMRTELDRSKSELDALVKDRNAMQQALKLTRRDICFCLLPRSALPRRSILSYMEEDIDVLLDELRRKEKAIGFCLLPRSALPRCSIKSYMEEDIDVLLDELRRKEKAIAILENNIDFLQVELRRRTDMYDDKYDYFGSISAQSGWSAMYVVTWDYVQTLTWAERMTVIDVEHERRGLLQDEKEMKIRVNKTHVTFGGKPTTSKDVQRYKTSVSFKGMSTEMLERQNYEKQPEEKEEEEEEFRAVEQMLMCKVCLDDDLSIVFLPCRHMATCERCASVLDNCPVCRSPIDEFLKVNYE